MNVLPICGMVGNTELEQPWDVAMEDYLQAPYVLGTFLHDSSIHREDIKLLETHVVGGIVIQVLSSRGPHWITNNQMIIIKQVLSNTYFGWD